MAAEWVTSSRMGHLVVLAFRLFICTGISVLGYWLAYHRTVQYKEVKQWVLRKMDVWRKNRVFKFFHFSCCILVQENSMLLRAYAYFHLYFLGKV